MIALLKNKGGVLTYIGEYTGSRVGRDYIKVKINSLDDIKNAISKDKVNFTKTRVSKKVISRKYDWDLSLINSDFISKIEKLIKDDNWKEIFMMHNDLGLSGDIQYCCNRHKKNVAENIKRFKDGQNKI